LGGLPQGNLRKKLLSFLQDFPCIVKLTPRVYRIAGIFVTGEDHTSYQIDNVTYNDAARFSRDALLISNRPGEYTNAQKFFGLTNDTAAGLNVSLWLVPVTNTTAFGAPIGMTSDDNSDDFLRRSIAQAQVQLDTVAISSDGSDVSATRNWTT
jgi:hypothetical protein